MNSKNFYDQAVLAMISGNTIKEMEERFYSPEHAAKQISKMATALVKEREEFLRQNFDGILEE